MRRRCTMPSRIEVDEFDIAAVRAKGRPYGLQHLLILSRGFMTLCTRTSRNLPEEYLAATTVRSGCAPSGATGGPAGSVHDARCYSRSQMPSRVKSSRQSAAGLSRCRSC
jgi:hypothetical protein